MRHKKCAGKDREHFVPVRDDGAIDNEKGPLCDECLAKVKQELRDRGYIK